LVKYQSRRNIEFFLIITFNLRDTGKKEYIDFISSTLKQLGEVGIKKDEVEEYYLADEIEGHPPNLRRLKFCVPSSC